MTASAKVKAGRKLEAEPETFNLIQHNNHTSTKHYAGNSVIRASIHPAVVKVKFSSSHVCNIDELIRKIPPAVNFISLHHHQIYLMEDLNHAVNTWA